MSRANALAVLPDGPGVKKADRLPVMLIEADFLESASLEWTEVVNS
jgi:hypothetical protein